MWSKHITHVYENVIIILYSYYMLRKIDEEKKIQQQNWESRRKNQGTFIPDFVYE
jgi:hypothetical protein